MNTRNAFARALTAASSSVPSWTITKTAADAWGNGGVFSSIGIPANGALKVVCGTARDVVVGLSTANGSASYDTIQYGVNLSSDRSYYIQELGVIKFTSAADAIRIGDGQTFVVRRTGTQIRYEVNGTVVYTSATASSGTLFVDVAMFRQYSILDGITLYDANGAVVDLTWTGVTGCTVQSVRPSRIEAWGDSLTEGPVFNGVTSYTVALGTLCGFAVNNNGISSETSTQIATRMLSQTSRRAAPCIIWAGRNDYATPTTVKANIASMVAALGHTHYLVLGVINGDYATEYSGGADYTTITTLNTDLAALYGTRFIDIRAHLVSLFQAGIPQDVIDHGHDVPPSSLRSDVLHMNNAGTTAVANKVFTKISTLLGVG
jgi:lysophospholipase L1-like esterase